MVTCDEVTLVEGGPAQLPFRDVVLLVPGFLGLGRLGRFHYFSERIAAALRAGLEARAGRPVLVVPCYTRPIGSLACRQRYLLAQLEAVRRGVPTVERFHLVGHSTGGVDAQLLACDRPLDGERWDAHPARALLASVVGISAPYHGTHLVQAPAVRLLAGELSGKGVTGFASLLLRLTRLLADQPAVGEILAGAHNQAPEAVAFLYQIFRHRELLDDLDPVRMAARRPGHRPDPRIPLTSFVTVAGLDRGGSPDGFFRAIHALTADSAVCTPRMAAALERIAPQCPFAVDERSSDGVVNAGLQLVDPSDPDELGGVVVADHADVIGHYDRGRRPLEERSQQIGLFHSGSGFDDDGFFRLYGGVVEAVSRAMPEAGQGRRTGRTRELRAER